MSRCQGLTTAGHVARCDKILDLSHCKKPIDVEVFKPLLGWLGWVLEPGWFWNQLSLCACRTLRYRRTMASLHRARQWLEALKFGIYLATPVAAVYVLSFGASGLLEAAIVDRAYVTYPPEGAQPPSMRELREIGRAADARAAARRAAE